MNTSTRLGDKLLEWLGRLFAKIETTKVGAAFLHLFAWTKQTQNAVTLAQIQTSMGILASMPGSNAQVASAILSLVTGQPLPADLQAAQTNLAKITKDPSGFIKSVAHFMTNNPAITEVYDTLGRLVEDVIITPIEDFVANNPGDPHAFLVRFHGKLAAVSLTSHILSLTAEILGVGQIQTVATAIHDTLASFGLSNVGAMVIEPLVTGTVRQMETRYYNERYRPHRFTPTELLSFYLRRKITKERLYREMGELGYRDEDTTIALDVADTDIRPNDVFQAYDLNMIDKTETASLLYERGYSPYGVDFLIRLQDEQKRQNDLNAISGVALQAFKKGILSENEYRQMRINAHVPRERIDIEVQLARLQMQTEKSDLSVSNIKGAFMNNVIARKEADAYLLDIGIDAVARQLMLDTWQEQKAPKVLRLNSSTVLAAYGTSVLDRNQTIDKLKSIGWSGADAELQVRIYDLRVTTKPRSLSEGAVLTAYHNGIVDTSEAIARLVELNYSPEDAALILSMADLKPVSAAKHLTESHIVKLYQLGIFEFVDAITELVNIGYDESTAQLVLIAQTTKVPKGDTLTQ